MEGITGFVSVELQTADGRFVTTQEIPPFHPYPEVILWGIRVFVRNTASMHLVYKEVFYYAIPVVDEVVAKPIDNS